jgi:hypothetical protein
VNVSATTTVAGALGAGVGGAVAKGVASSTSQPIIGNTLQAAGTPTVTGLTAGAIAEGATIGGAEMAAPHVATGVTKAMEGIQKTVSEALEKP